MMALRLRVQIIDSLVSQSPRLNSDSIVFYVVILQVTLRDVPSFRTILIHVKL